MDNKEIDIKVNICPHYDRGCDLLFPCCETFFPCRFCHDEKMDSYEMDPEKSHKADRKSIEQIKCRNCLEVQEITDKCIKCESILGNYFCNICKLLDLDDKGQFHCNGCGICRQGGQENFEHCDKCGICFAKSDFSDTHWGHPNPCSLSGSITMFLLSLSDCR